MRVLRDGEVAQVGEGVVDGHHIFDVDPHAEVNLQGSLHFAVEVGLLLEIADAHPQRHNLFVVELHSEMRVYADDIALNQGITLAVESTVQSDGEGTVEAFAEVDGLTAAFDIISSTVKTFTSSVAFNRSKSWQ